MKRAPMEMRVLGPNPGTKILTTNHMANIPPELSQTDSDAGFSNRYPLTGSSLELGCTWFENLEADLKRLSLDWIQGLRG